MLIVISTGCRTEILLVFEFVDQSEGLTAWESCFQSLAEHFQCHCGITLKRMIHRIHSSDSHHQNHFPVPACKNAQTLHQGGHRHCPEFLVLMHQHELTLSENLADRHHCREYLFLMHQYVLTHSIHLNSY